MISSTAAPETTKWFIPLRVFAVATVVSLLVAGQQWVASRIQGQSFEMPFVIVITFPFWYLWALLAPVVAAFARFVPIKRQKLALRVASHAAMALVLSLVHSVLHVGVTLALAPFLDLPIPEGENVALMVSLNWVQLSMNLLAYGGILGVTHAASFYRQFQEREFVAIQLGEQLAKAQLHALRMQLNPHFLFNAMNTISMLVRTRENSEAVKTIAGLSDLLRYVLDDTRAQEVTLREELGFVERYLAIEQVRFHDRLSVHVEPDAEVLEARVPSLVLQPLVENALHHGISKRVEAGEIRITARRENDVLVLCVEDDGPGLLSGAPDTDGLGVRNTRARLAQLYGPHHTVTLTNRETGGLSATVTVPFRLAPEDESGTGG